MMRADVYLAENGYVKSRQSAKNLIEKGSVKIDGNIVRKPSEQVDEGIEHSVEVISERFVSRGALKIEGALDNFKIDVKDKICIDIGASTGGFTDCLLSRGAAKVFAVDSGHGQLDMMLAANEKVVNIEGYNARFLAKKDFPCLFNMAVMDVSFISQTYILSGVADVLCEDGILISLIKPQFEAGRAAVGKNGIVKKPEDRAAALMRVIGAAAETGLFCHKLMRSPIDGGDGNIEYLACFTRDKNKYNVDVNSIKKVLSEIERGHCSGC